MRISHSLPLTDTQIPQIKKQLLRWSRSFTTVCWLDSNSHNDPYGNFEVALAEGVHSSLQLSTGGAFDALKEFRNRTADWIFGFLTYDLKNELEALQSKNLDGPDFPDLFFFQPKKLIILRNNQLQFLYLPGVASHMTKDQDAILELIPEQALAGGNREGPELKMRLDKDDYCSRVGQMLDHIKRGDIYEANYCQEFYAKAEIDPLSVYQKLNAISRAPFACFFRKEDQYLLCSSPERYICKRDTVLISQPIKGTARRSTDPKEDLQIAKALAADLKERTENIMIADLVRNDLSRIALKGSVAVPELCKVYTYEQVHQMISTIRAEIKPDLQQVDVLKATFPMGSMTGAPKISAMEIIENLELTKRGLYSGSVGYFSPDGDFDFNVVIRSILYNHQNKYVSFSVGSAITARSVPEKEYEECLLKAKAMRLALGADG